MLTIISSLASVAIPSYKSYLIKAKVVKGLSLLASYKLQIAEHYFAFNSLPGSSEKLFAGKSTLKLPKNKNFSLIKYTFESKSAVLAIKLKNPPQPGKEYIYVWGTIIGDFIEWGCSSNKKSDGISEQYYPKSCQPVE